jgi:carbon monoxide dehydrogenase subunit G
MQIRDSFRVTRPLEETWSTLLDVERIAPCLPGAELREVDGDEYRGVVKIKVGPITAQYQGAATLAEVDEEQRRVRIDASGRDTRGQGNAKAAITVRMAPDGDGTRVEIDTDVTITGKVAQFARGGVLQEVTEKLLGQFADNLERDVLAERPEPSAPERGGAERIEPGGAPAGARPVEPAEPVDLLELAGGSVARRLIPVVVAAVVFVVLLRVLRGLRR